MMAVLPGYAKVEAQLGLLRRRLNLRRVQEIFYRTGALFAVTLSALVSVALQETSTTFNYALWATVLVLIAAVAASLVTLHRNWLSLAKTSQIADRRAALEDRLSTLIAHQLSGKQPSLMADVLLSQLTAVAEQWAPTTIAALRIPRSFFTFLAALVLLIATVLAQSTHPDGARSTDAPARPTPATDSPPDSSTRRSIDSERSTASSPADLRNEPTRREVGAGLTLATTSRSQNPKPDARADGNVSPHTGSGGLQGQPSSAQNGIDEATTPGGRISQKAQEMIRQALGAQPLASPDRSGNDPEHDDRNSGNPGANRLSARSGRDQTPRGNERDREQENREGEDTGKSGLQSGDSQAPRDRPESTRSLAQQGSRSKAAGAAGAEPLGAPGMAASGSNVGSGLNKFTIRLSGTSRVVYATMERQPPQGGELIPPSSASSLAVPDAPLGPQSSEERGLHRSTIPTEQEATVRSIFSREADEQERP